MRKRLSEEEKTAEVAWLKMSISAAMREFMMTEHNQFIISFHDEYSGVYSDDDLRAEGIGKDDERIIFRTDRALRTS